MKAAVVLMVLGLVAVALFPIILIWSVNTLFSTSIPINVFTYVAALILSKPFVAFSISWGGR